MRAFIIEKPRTGALRALNYAPAVEKIRRAGSSSARPLSDIVKAFGPAYGAVFTRRDCHPDYGVELITQGDMFAAEPSGRVIRRDSMLQPELHLVTRGQVLIAGAGTLGESELYGRSILADDRLVGKYVGPHSMSLHFEEPNSDYSLFAYAWLTSPTGIQVLRSASYGTKILSLRKDLLRTLPVPLAPTLTVTRIADLIRRCSEGRERFLRDLREARRLIEAIPVMQAAHKMCAERRRSSMLWDGPFPTLSAWTYASPSGALDLLRRSWNGRLADVVESQGVFRGGRGPRIPCSPPHGVEFLSQRDAFLIRPVPQRVLLPSSGLIPQEGTIMVGGQGTLGEGEIFGRASLVTSCGTKSAWTEHLLRIVPIEGLESALFSYLTTVVGFRLLRSTAVGTKLLSMRPDLLLDLPIPDFSETERSQIDILVRSSSAARTEADQAEAEAIRIIEEEVLPQWLA